MFFSDGNKMYWDKGILQFFDWHNKECSVEFSPIILESIRRVLSL